MVSTAGQLACTFFLPSPKSHAPSLYSLALASLENVPGSWDDKVGFGLVLSAFASHKSTGWLAFRRLYAFKTLPHGRLLRIWYSPRGYVYSKTLTAD